ncbi:MAG: protein kinase [Erysipelotrichaceae bacterium]|nr:protein kinase [Erysipelotrichaceae bacterium]
MADYLNERYTILSLLGKGGMANVFLAKDKLLDRQVAIKVLKSELNGDKAAIERFKREALSIANLSHPNIVDIYDIREEDNNYYIVMEYIKGPTLKKLIAKRGALGERESVFLMKQLCKAVAAAHEKGIIHRDIKSQNIIIKDDGTLKVLDFGIALAHDAMQLTESDTIIGSVHYMAPELTKGSPANMQSDIYAMGIVFYELLTGNVPFNGDNPVSIALEHVKSEIPSVCEVNNSIHQSVENIVKKATAKDLSKRYKTVLEMLSDLNVCLNNEHLNDAPIDLDTSEKDKEETERFIKNRERRSSILIGVMMTLVLAIVGVLVFIILYLGGAFKEEKKNVVIPDISYMTVVDANKFLEDYGISIDTGNITRIVTDDVEKGLIIDSEPGVSEEVKVGTKIKVTVSDGIYLIMKDYVGWDILEAKEDLNKYYSHVTVVSNTVEDIENTPGKIVSQELILPNDKLDPNVYQDIRLTYVAYPSVNIPREIIGMSTQEARDYFAGLGIRIELAQYDTSGLSEEEKAELQTGHVYGSDPSVGGMFIQSADNAVVLYVY